MIIFYHICVNMVKNMRFIFEFKYLNVLVIFPLLFGDFGSGASYDESGYAKFCVLSNPVDAFRWFDR